MDICYECCVLSGRGLCDELITRPEESYRLWCVVCDLETSRMRRPWPALGRSATAKKRGLIHALKAHLILSYGTPPCCQQNKKNISVITFQDRLSDFILFCKGSRPLLWRCSYSAHVKITSAVLNCPNGHVIFRSQELDIPVLRQNVTLSLCRLWWCMAKKKRYNATHSYLMYLIRKSSQFYAPATLNCGTYFRWGWINIIEEWTISGIGRESSQDSFVIQPVPNSLYGLHYPASCNSKLFWFWENYLQLSISRSFRDADFQPKHVSVLPSDEHEISTNASFCMHLS